jgi:transglutaminase-like putative cysteine protease
MKSAPASRWDLSAAILLYLVLLLCALRFIATKWTTSLDITLVLTLFGVPLGLALGFSRFRSATVCWLALGYSLALLPWTLGVNLYKNMPWSERLLNLFGRLGASLAIFFQKKPVEDTLLFVLVTALVFWIVSLLAGYQWSRHENLVAGLLPVWVILVTIQVYDNIRYNRIVFLVFCMFFSLLLVGRRFILQKRRYWKENRIQYSAESSKEINLTLVIFTSAILLLAWVIPAPNQPVLFVEYVWGRITEPWQSTQKDLGNAVAGLEGSASSSSYDYYSSDRLQLGQKAITGNATIFVVKTPADPVPVPYYWRVRTYDLYENGQWSNSASTNQPALPVQPILQLPDSGMHSLSEFNIKVSRGPINNLFTPAQPVWISRPVNVALYQVGENKVDPILIQAEPAIQAGERYRVLAFQSDPTILELRQAGQEYPDWALRRYLEIPQNLSSKVRTLAARLTEGKETPYDKATAITDYLRSEITYSKVVSRPPFGADILEWFLLDYKQGYCNYYATAEVILLRVVGIPARMVVGFAEGEKDAGQPNSRTVHQKDAHAWPEVYFPGTGWVEFEPTSAQPVITRPSGIIPLFNNSQNPASNILPDLDDGQATSQPVSPTPVVEEPLAPESAGADESAAPIFVILLFGLIILGLSGFLFWRRQVKQWTTPTPLPIRWKNTLERNSIRVPGWLVRWAALAAEPPIQRAFNVIHRSLKRLGKAAQPAHTPLEASLTLVGILPAAKSEITSLQIEYQKFMYSQEPADAARAQRDSLEIQQQTNRAVLYNRLREIRGKFKPLFKSLDHDDKRDP